MLGGFLGSGKTTTLLRLAQQLQRAGKRVGIITNDQAAGLVDTALMEELKLPVSEIAGGCFCCRSGSLVEALGKLTAASQPEVFLAEPVGSCTDLVATVSLPLERIYNAGFTMAPYAVLVDPYRAMQTLGVEELSRSAVKAATGRVASESASERSAGRIPRGGGVRVRETAGKNGIQTREGVFSPDVNYIYRKQLEEAEIIVINKTDVIAPERLVRLREALGREYPDAEILCVASREGTGLDALFEALTTREGDTRRVMEVDYARYGKGEAMLGWYNGQHEVRVTGSAGKGPMGSRKAGPPEDGGGPGIDGNAWLLDLALRVRTVLRATGTEIAHFKMSLVEEAATEDGGRADGPGAARASMAAVSLVSSDREPELRRVLDAPLERGLLTVNLRAEGMPELLAIAVQEALKSNPPGLKTKRLAEEAFRPGQPIPTHRVAAV
jgi:G3E family GTPase